MAGTATHLAIADILYAKLGKKIINNPSLYFSGNIAPDAVHARTNYQRSDKKHTHLTEGISGSDFKNADKVTVFHERLRIFAKNYYHVQEPDSDLYLGYITHLITDELFNIHIRQQFVAAMEIEGISQEDPEFFRRIIHDIESVDSVIVNRYPYMQNIHSLLENVWDYEIHDYISADEINRSKRWVLDTFFSSASAKDDFKYYSYESACSFIHFAAEHILYRLIEMGIVPKDFDGRIHFHETLNSRFIGNGKAIIRSDSLLTPDESDKNWLLSHHIGTILDLRNDREVTYRPCAVPEGIQYHHCKMHESGILPPKGSQIGAFYYEMSQQKDFMYPVFKTIAEAPNGVIFFCRSGKDRTGITSALLLALCGYTKEYIAEDYEKSAENLAEIINNWLPNHPDYERAAITPHKKHILTFLDLINKEYESIEHYFLFLGLTLTDIEALRKKVG